jgi:hypothetical protein
VEGAADCPLFVVGEQVWREGPVIYGNGIVSPAADSDCNLQDNPHLARICALGGHFAILDGRESDRKPYTNQLIIFEVYYARHVTVRNGIGEPMEIPAYVHKRPPRSKGATAKLKKRRVELQRQMETLQAGPVAEHKALRARLEEIEERERALQQRINQLEGVGSRR